MFDVLARKTQRILAVPERTKLRELIWSDNETLLIIVSETIEARVSTEFSHEYFRTIAHDVSGGIGRMLPTEYGSAPLDRQKVNDGAPPPKWAPLANLIAAHTTKPQTVIMSTYGWCNAVVASCLLEVDTRTGQGTIIKVGNKHTTMWIVNRDGQPVAREDWDPGKHSYRVFALEGNSIREILRHDDSEHPALTTTTLQGEDHWLSRADTRIQVLRELDRFLKDHL
jgi:hypothetical protein